jgi:hypothetical protein
MTPDTENSDAERRSSAYFDLEPVIRDLRHMAGIAWALFEEKMKAPADGTGYRKLQLTNDEFEMLEFAVVKTMGMARDLDEVYLKKFNGE